MWRGMEIVFLGTIFGEEIILWFLFFHFIYLFIYFKKKQRALGDQFNGDGENHFEYRQNTIKYIKDHREDFEPFLEEDTGFDEYVKLLGQSGTYAGHWYF